MTKPLPRLLYPPRDAKVIIGCGTTQLYSLLNQGRLKAKRLGKRTYITAESLEALVASLPPVVTPTMRKLMAERERLLEHREEVAAE